mgnify:CR=1 FL=1
MNIEKLVHEKVLAVVRLRRPHALGLDSLDLAQLGAEIETALDAPIYEEVAVGAVHTIGDMMAICEETLAKLKRAS